MDAAFFNAVRSLLYGGSLNQAQVDALNAIGAAWEQYGDGDDRKLAYILATAHHETGGFRYMREIWGPTAAQKRYEGRKDLGNTQPGDGKRFMGRGFVQLTGRRNYADWSKRTGLDLVGNPDLVVKPEIAARILVQGSMLGTFTGKKLGDYASFRDMRRVINGTDRAGDIALYADRFLAALLAVKEGVSLPPQDDIPHHPEQPSSGSANKRSGIPGWIIAAGLLVLAAVLVALFTPIF